MKLHSLNCGSLCIRGIQQIQLPKFSCQCWLLELSDRLVLVDTGFSSFDIKSPLHNFGRAQLLGLQRNNSLSAIQHIKKLGYDPRNVKDIIITHLDYDHMAGIQDFPAATVHVMKDEMTGALEPKGIVNKFRFARATIKAHKKWQLYDSSGESWGKFKKLRPIERLGIDLSLIPLPGHTNGHWGVYIQNGDESHFHIGDSCYFHSELKMDNDTHPGLIAFRKFVHTDYALAMENLSHLQMLSANNPNCAIVTSHDEKDLFNKPITLN